ncbi:MAG TPA: aspartyl/asparaginyl beta-hydroxylase domain-containing protein [Caulobacteraceae bacterium]
MAPERLDLWMGLAASQRGAGELVAAVASVDGALAIEPRFFPALLMKGSLLDALGRTAEAAKLYGVAVQLAPPPERLAEPTRRALDRAAEVHRDFSSSLAEALGAEIDESASSLGRRAKIFVDAVAGRRRIFQQDPIQIHYPGLAAIEFWDREEFPFLPELESHFEAIRAEALAVWTEGSPDLTPYVHYPPGAPLDQWAELNNSLNWSAFHLWLDGALVEANAEKCPATMAALNGVDQPHTTICSPAAMFSILRPNTRIPPHTGVANTRLVLHLPLIVPEDCGFRCGGETREWREGEAFIFDDTIEHEAWNNSDKPRAVLICDVWNPRLSNEERDLITRVMTTLNRINGGTSQMSQSL